MGKAALILLAALAACTPATRPAAENPRQIWCDHNTPRRPTVEAIAAMSEPELDDLLTYNRTGAAWCGWTP